MARQIQEPLMETNTLLIIGAVILVFAAGRYFYRRRA